MKFDAAEAQRLDAPELCKGSSRWPIIYSYGDFLSSTKPVLLGDAEPAAIDRAGIDSFEQGGGILSEPVCES